MFVVCDWQTSGDTRGCVIRTGNGSWRGDIRYAANQFLTGTLDEVAVNGMIGTQIPPGIAHRAWYVPSTIGITNKRVCQSLVELLIVVKSVTGGACAGGTSGWRGRPVSSTKPSFAVDAASFASPVARYACARLSNHDGSLRCVSSTPRSAQRRATDVSRESLRASLWSMRGRPG